eukprot:TRINITY_DN66277_c0_g1_i1.p1 TRINITY_DN66277_c0_g1~~TRINITY_DN66277_c0_g1_i1.p1  ORF type:complete len:239 (-),score=49.49 TRINITY_DN66277_c0_g1_i1:152-868(-)
MAAAAQRWLRPVRLTGQPAFARAAPSVWAASWRCPSRCLFVSAEPTPNPESFIFRPETNRVLGSGFKTMKFTNKYETNDSPLASAIFKVRGVGQVLLASEHITVTKMPQAQWSALQPSVELVISQFFAARLEPVKEHALERDAALTPEYEEGSIEQRIVELLEERVRPFVQQDGGDIEFDRFDGADGTLYVKMHGACSGCPKSSETLQSGIKNLMEHYIPEVQAIANVEDEEAIPRPH